MEWNENLTRIADFAESRHVDRNVMTQYIRYHPELFNEHITEHKRSLYGDADAIKALDIKYPLPKPIEIVNDPEATELRKQIIELQASLIEAKEKITSLTERAALADMQRILIDDKDRQIETQSTKLSELESENISARENLIRTDMECNNLKTQLQQEKELRMTAEAKLNQVKNMSLLQRLFWKW